MSRKHPATRIASLTLATLLFFTTAVSAAPGTINATDVKFRKAPNTSAEILDVLDKNTPLEVTGREGDWVSVEKGGTSGYVYATYVTVPETASSETAALDNAASTNDAAATVSRAATELTGFVNASDVKFRSGPDTSFDILRVLNKNTQVVVLKKLESWQQVRIDGVEGYIYDKYVTVAAPAAHTEDGLQIMYVNANSLNIRSLPTSTSEKLGELYRRNQVVYLENIAGWARIQTKDGIIGYVLPNYLVDSEAGVSRGNEEKVERLLKISKTFLGVPYVHGGNSMRGTDCSGFVKMAFAKVGITTPRSSSAYASAGVKVSPGDLRPGDVVIFDIRGNGAIGHVGIYLGGDQFIHASSTNGKVVIAKYSTYNEIHKGARRFIR
jgi:cell wall-associated NlpC family hydrolase